MISTDHKLMRIDTGHQTVEITLDDAYKRYQAAPDPLQEVAADMLKQLAEMLPTGRCIVPVIKEKAWLDTVRQQLSQYESDPEVLNASLDFAWEDFNDELIILFAEDGSETMRYLMRYEVTIDREQAINNLKQILPEVSAEIVDTGANDGKVAVISAGGTYEPSLMLIDDLWVQSPDPECGDLLVTVPSRGKLFFTHNDQPANLSALRQLTEQCFREDDHPLTTQIFIRRNGHFYPWVETLH
ncbi:hypothetical protein ECPV1252_06740 [Escherichia coli]